MIDSARPDKGERSSVVERHLAKVAVVGSNPIARSIFLPTSRAGVLGGRGEVRKIGFTGRQKRFTFRVESAP